MTRGGSSVAAEGQPPQARRDDGGHSKDSSGAWPGASRRGRRHRDPAGDEAGNQLLQLLHSGNEVAVEGAGLGAGWAGEHVKGQGRQAVQPSSAASAEGGGNLRELLAQVAPQARVHESASQLKTRASARILTRVLGASKGLKPSAFDDERPLPGPGLPEFFCDPRAAITPSGVAPTGSIERQPGEEDQDDDEAFNLRWKGLFGKGSPLVEGTAKDPFKEDLRRRAKVVWKKNHERPGHRQRYQQRRQEKARQGGDGLGSDEAATASPDDTVSLRYDVSKPLVPPSTFN